MPVHGSVHGQLHPGVALVPESHLDRLPGRHLRLLDPSRPLRRVRLVGRGDQQRQQVAQRVDRQVHRAALPPHVAEVASPRPVLRPGLQRPAVQDRRPRLGRPLRALAQQPA